MNISNTPDFSGSATESYSTNKQWSLTNGDETKIVYVRFINDEGDTLATDSIVLDTTPPGTGGTLIDVEWTSMNAVGNLDFTDAGDPGGSGIAYYGIYWGTNAESTVTNAADSVTSAFNPGALGSPGTYYLRVKAIDNAGNEGNWQTIMYYQYDGGTPAAPGNLQSNNASNNVWTSNTNHTFSWDAVSPVSGVDKYYYTTNGVDPGGVDSSVASNNRTFEDNGVGNGSFTIKVRALSNSGIWGTVSSYTLKVDAGVPDAPGSLSVLTQS
ncbi:MAG: hypothetical protein PHV30_05600, partial [Candidatus Margulisbacteria bacterium]|nr:hypothetical protein [Candidatus Margulisiibacteriota bacterium]